MSLLLFTVLQLFVPVNLHCDTVRSNRADAAPKTPHILIGKILIFTVEQSNLEKQSFTRLSLMHKTLLIFCNSVTKRHINLVAQ